MWQTAPGAAVLWPGCGAPGIATDTDLTLPEDLACGDIIYVRYFVLFPLPYCDKLATFGTENSNLEKCLLWSR